jgi:hypothetical protein
MCLLLCIALYCILFHVVYTLWLRNGYFVNLQKEMFVDAIVATVDAKLNC